MARFMRSYGKSYLRPPSGGPGIAWHGPGTYLTYPNATQDRLGRRGAKYRLRPPVVVTAAAVYPPITTHLVRGQDPRREAKSRLQPPAVVGAGLVNPGLRIKLIPLSRRPVTHSHLPVVVVAAVAQVFYGPAVHATRGRRGQPKSFLHPPTDTIGLEDQGRVRIELAPQRRGVPKSRLFEPTDTIGLEDQGRVLEHLSYSRRGAPKSHLQPPAVVAPVVSYGPAEWLSYSRRGRAFSHLPQVIVAVAAQVYYGPAVHLTRIRPRHVQYVLHAPTDTIGLEDQGLGPKHLAYSRRGTPKNHLSAPVVVFLAVELSGPEQWLTYSRRGTPSSALRPPTDTVGLEDQGRVLEHLAYSRRGVPKSHLYAPTVVFTAVELSGPEISLARIKPPQRFYRLFPPAVVSSPPAYAQVIPPALAYSRRGAPKSRLAPPTVVFPFFPREEPIALIRIKPPLAQANLFPPAVTAVSVISYGPFEWLTYSRRGRPQSHLFGPVVLQSNLPTVTALAYSRRGAAKPHLSPPVVVFLAVEIFGPEVTLTPSRRPVTKSELRPPAVVAPVVSYGPAQWMTYSRRGTAKPRLEPPAVVSSPPAYAQVVPPTFAPQRRGRPVYRLRPPTRVFPVLFYGPAVTLRPQVRGIPKPFLKPPTVVRLAVEIYGPVVELTYSRRGKPRSFRIPFTPGKAPFRPVQVHLTAIKPRPTVALIKPPTRVFVLVADVTHVHLTYSRRGRPINFRQPEVAAKAPFRGIQVHLARITPVPTLALVKPPSVIGAGIAFYGPLTALVRIKHPPVHYFLRTVLVAFRRPHGDVCGFDIATTFVCTLELPGSQVTGIEAVDFQITGSSRAGTKITGTESPGGGVSGSDRKAT